MRLDPKTGSGWLIGSSVDELTSVEQLVGERPRAWPEVEPGVRRVVMHRFPYALLYEIVPHGVQVLAVAHQSRRPGYWRDR